MAKKVYFKKLREAFDQLKVKRVKQIQKAARRYISKLREEDRIRNEKSIMI